MHKKDALKFLILCIIVPFTVACNPEHFFESQGSVFHTVYRIKYKSPKPIDEPIIEALEYVDKTANPFNTASLLYAVNNNLPQWKDDGLLYLFRKAGEVHNASEGRFDITVGPLVNIWGFGYEASPYEGDVPLYAIDSLREFIGYDKVVIQADTLVKSDPRVSIDMASIAKGYACDKVAEALRGEGVVHYLVEIGGEIAFSGLNPNGQEWKVGINVPQADTLGLKDGVYEMTLTLKGTGGVATSGNYRNFKVDPQGHTYAHTIDPIDGCPVQRDVLSATVVAHDTATADALATACMVLGSKKAFHMIENFEGAECILMVTNDKGGYDVKMTEGIKDQISYM